MAEEDKHYTIEEALKMEGIYKQTYDLIITEVGELKTYDKRDGSGKLKVQDLWVSDGTASIKYPVFYPTKEYKKGMGIHATGVYIKEKDGYFSLKIAQVDKGGSIKISEKSDIVPKLTPVPEKNEKSEKKSTGAVALKEASKEVFYAIWDLLSTKQQEDIMTAHESAINLINITLLKEDN